ncbi:hypothetical protein [uncultured Litoreibacter sp.]|uniref:hypothetical protein n=1 Tax=uncultured Litoreibacter sp. TaxID=1392394 RepID=UPI002633AF06|nr:hypothetical protein [uncultured Litoreibacter sp.]
MPELVTLLTIYYACAADAAVGVLTQPQRFACNETYQQAKRLFADEPHLRHPGSVLTPEQNTVAYLRLRAWEAENASWVREVRGW